MQSRTESFIESTVNIAIGMAISLLSQIVIFPMYGINIPIETNISLMLWFTLVSITRSYVLRRVFNKRVIARIKREQYDSE